jgi:MFS family permease
MIMGATDQPSPTRAPRLRAFTAYRFFSACLPYLPIATACFLARGLSMGQVVALSMIYAVGTAVFGVPLAQLADRWGYRRALVLGAGALAVGAALASMAHGQGAFIAAQLALAAGAALDSGTDSAYLFQHLGAHGASLAEYRRAEARSASVKLLGNVAGFAIGGALAAASPVAPFIAGAVCAAIAAACASRLETSPVPAAVPRRAPLRATVRELLAVADLRRLFVLAAVCAAMARVAITTAAPYLESLDVSLTAVGVLTALGAVGAAVAARHAVRLADRLGDRALLAALPVVLLACIIALGIGAGTAVVALALVPQILAGLHAPVWRSHLNARIADSSRRATVLAIDGTFSRAMYAAIAGVLFAVSSVGDSRSALVGCAVIAAALILAVAVFPGRRGGVRSRRMRVAWAVSGLAALAILTIGSRGRAIAQGADQRHLVGEAPGDLLVPHDLAVGGHDEVTTAAADQLDLDVVVELLLESGGQTGRPWPVASSHAVFDGDAHTITVVRRGTATSQQSAFGAPGVPSSLHQLVGRSLEASSCSSGSRLTVIPSSSGQPSGVLPYSTRSSVTSPRG